MGKFNFIWLSCKKATYLISKKEEAKLSRLESVQLRMHLGICGFCNRFQKQTRFFTHKALHLHNHIEPKLSDEKKEEIKLLLKD